MAMSPTVNNNATLTLDSDPKPTARRRQAIVTEKKSIVEMIGDGVNPAICGDKDLSHTLRGETTWEIKRSIPCEERSNCGFYNFSQAQKVLFEARETPVDNCDQHCLCSPCY